MKDKVPMTIYVDKELLRQLNILSATKGVTRGSLINDQILEVLKNAVKGE